MSRTQVIVDERGRRVGAPDGTTVGFPGDPLGMRQRWALPTNAPGGGLSLRYAPSWSPGESGIVGYDFSMVVPPGVGITAATLVIFTNLSSPASSSDFTIGPVTVGRRMVYAVITGGISATDYQLRWRVTDTQGDVWPRTALLLCSLTS